MRVIDWHKVLERQRVEHNKVVFSITELANLSGLSPQSLSMALRRLVSKGVIMRYSTGLYGLPGAAGVEDIVPALDSMAYITGMYLLYNKQIVFQAQREITCFTRRRHNRGRLRETALGRIVFMCVSPAVYNPPARAGIVSLEQALCDALYICRKRGMRAHELVTFRNLERINKSVMNDVIEMYPASVQRDVEKLLSGCG